jgi:formylglycine-generating enzyme required for sulfatase activity
MDSEAPKRKTKLVSRTRKTKIATDGGAAIRGSVKTRGGDFIGRDFIQIIEVHRGEDPDDAQGVVAHYLAALANDLAGLRLGEIDVSAKDMRREPLQLADVYVPLDTHLRIPHDLTLTQWFARSQRVDREDLAAQRETRPVSALEALARHREMTVLGKPGSGKSTFGASVLLTLAQVWQGHSDELTRLGESWTHGALLPIRVILRHFAEQLQPSEKPARAGDLWAFIGEDLRASGYGLSADTMKYVERIARSHGALFLLDGLDECGSSETRRRVLAAVDEIKRSASEKCRFLLTARPYAWPGGPAPVQGVYALDDLNDEQVEHFIHGWYRALVTRKWLAPGEAERKRGDLLDARQRADLEPLTRNPLLLTLTASLHANRGRLPDDQADLYHQSVDLLMLRWNRQIGADRALLDELAIPSVKLTDLREVLEELAFKVHEDALVKEPAAESGTADIGEDRLVRAFRALLNNSRDKAAIVVDYIEKRAGLLIGQGEKDGERQFTFPHRTFQEFLAASHLAAQDDFPATCVRLARAAPGHWQVVLALAARLAKAERGASAADELIGGIRITEFSKQRQKQPVEADWMCALLAGMQLQEIGAGAIRKRERTAAILARVADWLVASLPLHPNQGGLPASVRASAGDVLARLGDPRFDVERFYLPSDDMLGFVRIPADPQFRIGTRRADVQRIAKIIGTKIDDDKINDVLTPTAEFHIARYPVTVAQFRAFVEESRFKIGAPDTLRDPDNHPVSYVSWHEALAYCDWLSQMLATSPPLADSQIARLVRENNSWRATLPSELEWEKAARGGLSDTIFSWGDNPDPNYANYDETEIADTSAVGCFPANGFGLSDMLGNVWEWTRSLWGADLPYPYDPNDRRRDNLTASDKVSRVVRGGSWLFHRDYARCACRRSNLPVGHVDDFGFQVVLRSAPVV